MMRRLFLVLVLAAGWWGLPIAQVSAPLSLIFSNEGSVQGSIRELNCVGAAVDCTLSGATGTMTITLAAANLTGTVAIANGGTGQTTQTAAFDALAPTTTAGDLIYHNGTDNIRLGIGTAGQYLTVNSGATAPEWTTRDTVLTLAGQVATGANQNLVDLTGMAFTAAAGGIYTFQIHAAVNNAANTTGYGIGINCAQAPQRVWMTGGSQLANTGTESQWSAIANNAIVGVTSGVPTNATDVPVFGHGQILANATTAGTCTFRFRSEVNAVARMQAGSVFLVRRVN